MPGSTKSCVQFRAAQCTSPALSASMGPDSTTSKDIAARVCSCISVMAVVFTAAAPAANGWPVTVTASCIQPMSKSCCVRVLVICVRNQNVLSSGNWGHREA